MITNRGAAEAMPIVPIKAHATVMQYPASTERPRMAYPIMQKPSYAEINKHYKLLT